MASIDQVSMKVGSGHNLIPVREFLDKPLTERIQLISSGGVQFLSAGSVLPLGEAVKIISTMK